MKEQIWAIDPLQAIFDTAMVEHLVSKTLMGRRFVMFLLGGFAVATLLLALAGVYGVMSFSATHRMREFGIRVALGAARWDIVGLVLGEGLKLAVLGVIVGVLAALPLAQLLRALLYGVTATDLVTFLIVTLGLLLVAALACYVPARRALKVDPAQTLRFE
jgi:ABC-type antimicrobial peptide transport system permease subunit